MAAGVLEPVLAKTKIIQVNPVTPFLREATRSGADLWTGTALQTMFIVEFEVFFEEADLKGK